MNIKIIVEKIMSKERFLQNISEHEMKVLLDNGLHRHLYFAKKGTLNCHFEIITWPGYLAIVGDMGDFVFTRVKDMFDFFGRGEINPKYWAEKCVAGETMEFDQEDFLRIVNKFCDDHEIDEDTRQVVLAAENEYDAHTLCSDLIPEIELWDYQLKTPTYHYLWCCYAITWGIGKYYERETYS